MIRFTRDKKPIKKGQIYWLVTAAYESSPSSVAKVECFKSPSEGDFWDTPSAKVRFVSRKDIRAGLATVGEVVVSHSIPLYKSREAALRFAIRKEKALLDRYEARAQEQREHVEKLRRMAK